MRLQYLFVTTLLFVVTGCAVRDQQVNSTVLADADDSGLAIYEAMRIRGLAPTRRFQDFQPTQGFRDLERDANGRVRAGTLRVLVDNPSAQVHVIGDFNDWKVSEASRLQPVPGQPQLVELRIDGLRHGQEYRLVRDGHQLLDPAASFFTPVSDDHDNAIFWDFDRPGAYKPHAPVVDLRSQPTVIGESEVFELAHHWQEGPDGKRHTYRFIAESGLVEELKRIGYNAVEFLPFNASMDGDAWKYRYQVFGLFAPDARYGTPDDFAKMIDAFNAAGIAVIMDAVVGHYPYKCESGGPCALDIGDVGLHQWKKADGSLLYGGRESEWQTKRYDYENPYIRRFLIDSILHMMSRYGIAGVRFDNYDGIRFLPGGTEFLKQLAADVREYRPEAFLIAEMFFGENKVLHTVRCSKDENARCKRDQFGNPVVPGSSGFGINLRTHSTLFDFVKDNMLQNTENVNMDTLVHAIRDPWGWQEAARVSYITNHDEAANRRDGATGSYIASLVIGEGNDDFRTMPEVGGDRWKYVQRKTKAFATLAMLAGSAYLDMPQLRLQQRGSFYSNPAVDWGQRGVVNEQQRVYNYFKDLSRIYTGNPAFAFHNLHGNIENHYDPANKVISLYRRDPEHNDHLYAVINLGHQALYDGAYTIGVHKAGSYKLLIDSDDKQYVGDAATHFATGALRDKIAGAGNVIWTDDCHSGGAHGKPCKLVIPYLGEHAAILLKWEH